MIGRWFRDLPLLWKLLVPSALTLAFIGASAVFLLVRDQTNRAQAAVNRSLTERSLQVRTALQQEQLSLLEATNLAANLRGMAEAVAREDRGEVEQLLRSVAAIKPTVTTLAVVDDDGALVVELGPSGQRGPSEPNSPVVSAHPVHDALAEGGTSRHGGVVDIDGRYLLSIAAPICRTIPTCDVEGAVLAAADLGAVVQAVPRQEGESITLFTLSGEVIASAGERPPWEALTTAGPTEDEAIRTSSTRGGASFDTLHSPMRVREATVGSIAVTLPTDQIFADVRTTGLRLAAILGVGLLAMIGAIGAITRSILRQVRDVVTTNSALEGGDLGARVEHPSRDEIGTIARGLNQMAARLQRSHEDLEDRVDKRTQQVQELLTQRTEFFASLSHELRTPIAIILSQSDLLLLSPKDTEAVRRSGRSIKQTADGLLGVVNEILELARAEIGELQFEARPVDITEVLTRLHGTLADLVATGGQELVVDAPPLLPTVSADASRLQDVVVNLVDNAVKYSAEGTTIRIRVRDRDDAVVIEVHDQGTGIPEGTGDDIFEPFRRVESSVPREGRHSTGLGLTLSRRLAQAMGGDLTYTSTEGEGSCFTLSLPVVSVAAGG